MKKHAFVDPISAIGLGALSTVVASKVMHKRHNSRLKKIKEELKKDVVDTKRYLAKTGLPVLTTTEEIDNSNLSEPAKGFAKNILLNESAAYVHGKRDGVKAFIAMPRENKYILGHELGHSMDEQIGKRIFFPVSRAERVAWNNSPEKDTPKILRNAATGTYNSSAVGNSAVVLSYLAGGVGALLH